VLLSSINCTLVVDECLSLTTPSQLPHYYIVKTLADVAANQPVQFVQKLKEVMARLTPVMGNIKKSPMKWVFATGACNNTHKSRRCSEGRSLDPLASDLARSFARCHPPSLSLFASLWSLQ